MRLSKRGSTWLTASSLTHDQQGTHITRLPPQRTNPAEDEEELALGPARNLEPDPEFQLHALV